MAKAALPPWVAVVIALLVLAGIGFLYWRGLRPQGGDMALSKEEYERRTQQRMQYKEPPYRPGGQLMPEATAKPSLGASPLESRPR